MPNSEITSLSEALVRLDAKLDAKFDAMSGKLDSIMVQSATNEQRISALEREITALRTWARGALTTAAISILCAVIGVAHNFFR